MLIGNFKFRIVPLAKKPPIILISPPFQTKKDPTNRWNYPDWWYTKTFLEGRVEILFLDTSVLKGKSQWNSPAFSQKSSDKNEPTPDEKREAHYQWIENTMRASTAEILMVTGHYPVYSAGPHGSTKELYTNLQPMLEKYNVTHCEKISFF